MTGWTVTLTDGSATAAEADELIAHPPGTGHPWDSAMERCVAHDETVDTNVDEIADGIFRLSTWIPDISPEGFTFNQFLVTGEQPFLFHTGLRQLFPLLSRAIARIISVEQLRWISVGHIEADECGAVNLLLTAAPHAQVIQGALACAVSLNDICDRQPVVADEQPRDIGGHRLRFIPTPHVPHNWEAGLWFDETTSTLLAGDLNFDVSHAAPAGALRNVGFRNALALPSPHTTTPRGLFRQPRKIDWAYVSGPAEPILGRVHNTVNASDHYPISFTLKIG